MPYVDPGEKQKRTRSTFPIVSVMAAVLASAIGPLLWLGCYKWFGMSYPGALLCGLAIGLAIKFTLKQESSPLRIAAIVLTVLASFAGYVWVDSKIWTPFMFGQAASRFSHDIQALIFVAAGCWIAYALASPRMASPVPAARREDDSQ